MTQVAKTVNTFFHFFHLVGSLEKFYPQDMFSANSAQASK
nr:MAG TPA: hypothetical protein [Caudoviricetes sp.]